MPALPVEHSSTRMPGRRSPRRLRLLEHVQVDAVLEAAGGAVPLDLDVDGRARGGDPVELHERRAAHRAGDGRQRGAIRIPARGHDPRVYRRAPTARNAAGVCAASATSRRTGDRRRRRRRRWRIVRSAVVGLGDGDDVEATARVSVVRAPSDRAAASWTSRRRLCQETAAAGASPQRAWRHLTSTKTTASPSRQTRSSSPRAKRTLRSTTRSPARARKLGRRRLRRLAQCSPAIRHASVIARPRRREKCRRNLTARDRRRTPRGETN